MHHCIPTSRSVSWSTTGRQKISPDESSWSMAASSSASRPSTAIHAGLLNPSGASAKFVLRKLRHHGKRRHKKGSEERRGKFVISHPIENRPASAANRSVRATGSGYRGGQARKGMPRHADGPEESVLTWREGHEQNSSCGYEVYSQRCYT